MRMRSGGTPASPRLVGFLVLVGAVVLAYEIGQWVLSGTISGLGINLGELAGIAIAMAVLVRWRMGILLFLFWLAVEDLARKYMGSNMYIYFVKDALVAVVYVSFFVDVTRHREKLFRPRFWAPLMAIFLLALAQVFNPRSTSLFYGVMGMKLDFYYVPLIFLGYALLRSRDDLDSFLSFSFLLAIFVSAVGILQGLGWSTFLNPANLAPQFVALGHLVRYAPGISGSLSAPPSVFVSQGRYANYLELMFSLALGAVAYQVYRRRPAKLAYVALSLLGIAIFLSGSKGALVYGILTLAGLGAGLLWGTRNQPWVGTRLGKIMRRSLIALVVSLALLIYLYPNLAGGWWTYYYDMLWPDSSTSVIAARTGSYPLDEFEKVLDYKGWQLGYGTGTASLGTDYITGLLKEPPPPAGPVENGFGDLLIEWGLLGPILWVTMALSMVLAAWKTTRSLAATPFYPLALSIAWFVFWVLLPFTWGGVTTYQNYIVNAYLWILVGMLFRLPVLARQPERGADFAADVATPPAELARPSLAR